MALSEMQIAAYKSDGYLSPLTAFGTDHARDLLAKFEKMEAETTGTGKLTGTIYQYRPYLHQEWAAALVRDEGILDAVASLIGPDVLVYHLTIWVKEPHSDAYISWHQDSTYFGLEPFEHVTAWVALSDATETMGCVSMIPGSHLRGELTPDEIRSDSNLLLRGGQVVAVDEGQETTVPQPLKAGEYSLHHTLTLHASGANRSDQRRVGFGISYIPTRCRCTARQRVRASLVRGTDRFGHFDLEPDRLSTDPAVNRAELAESMRRWELMRKETVSAVQARIAG